jgi:hypothetical protein
MKVIIKSIPPKIRIKVSQIILIFWGIYMAIIVPINHFLFPAWFHGDMGILFGDSFDLWAVWLIGAYSIGLGIGCFIAATDPLRYYATVLEILVGTLSMAVVSITSVYFLGTDPLRWTTYFTGILLILFCLLILLVYPLTPIKYSREDNIN